MADVTGSIGNEFVELNNAATEATLKLLLTAVMAGNKQNLSQIQNLAKQAGLNAQAVQSFNQNLQQTSSSAGNLNTNAQRLGATFSGMMPAFGAFTSKLIAGTAQTSDLFDAFSKLPGVLGVVASGLKKVADFQEQNFITYQKITNAGANFGGSLTEMRVALQGARLTADEFAKVLSSNSDAFVKMGTDANNGAKNFFAFTSNLMASETGAQLRALGFTAEQVNSGLANYIAMSGGRNRQEMQNTAQLTASAKAYFEQLDALATLQGKNREELEKEMNERKANAAIQNYLASLDVKEREKATAALNEALIRGGKGAEQALASRLMGIPPLTPAAQEFETVTRHGSRALGALEKDVKDASKSVADVQRTGAQVTAGLARDGKENQALFRANVMAGGELAEISSRALAAANQAQMNDVRTQADEEERLRRVQEEQKKRARESEARTMADAKKALEDLGLAILEGLMPVVRLLTPVLKFFAELVRDTVTPIVQVLGDMFEFMEPYFRQIGTILKDVWSWYLTSIGEVFKILEPYWVRFKDALKGGIVDFFERLGEKAERIANGFKTLDDWFGGKLSPLLATVLTGFIAWKLFFEKGTPKVGQTGPKPGSTPANPVYTKVAGLVPGGSPANPLFVFVTNLPGGGRGGRGQGGRGQGGPAGGGGGAGGRGAPVPAGPTGTPPPSGGSPPRPPVGAGAAGAGATAAGAGAAGAGAAGAGATAAGAGSTAAGAAGATGGKMSSALGKFSTALKSMRGIPALGALVGALDIIGVAASKGEYGDDTQRFYADLAGAVAGMLGGAGGAAVGAALGSVVPGIGTLVGAVGGGLLGNFAGDWAAKKIVNWIFGSDEPAKMANGAFVTKPTMALVGEGNEDEIVSPVSKMKDLLLEAVQQGKASSGGDLSSLSPSGTGMESMISSLERLNNNILELIRSSQEIAKSTRETVDATKNLSGDLFA